jgi:hypothetical protein
VLVIPTFTHTTPCLLALLPLQADTSKADSHVTYIPAAKPKLTMPPAAAATAAAVTVAN